MSKERLLFLDRTLLDYAITAVQTSQSFNVSHVCHARCSKQGRFIISFILSHVSDPQRQAEVSLYRYF